MRARTMVHFVLVASILSLLSGCGAPTAKIVSVKIGRVSPKSATLIFDLEVNNPYAVALPLAGAEYALSTEGQEFMTGQADIQGVITAGETKQLSLPVQVRFLELFRAVKGVRGKSEIPYTADFGLFVKPPAINKLRLPMQRKGTLKLPTAQGLLNRAIPLLKK
ncbi:MAG: hypothetical protein DRP83_07525 [Planctomycetota bacterium]|nr:MAG: hypothetical protein DRP83_07525 [Planctomycetota bacterium]